MVTIRNTFRQVLVPVLLAFVIATIMPGLKTEARASGAAFLGGMVAGHLIGGAVHRSRIRTAAAVETASQPKTQTVYVQQPPTTTSPAPSTSSTGKTAEQRIKELDKLAKDGYITPEEYKARKKAILDSL